ncbi:hypothetical protein F4820DRAFT_426923 [Hypoxylon rubiginosum]|uniref:Uncharacterized protein n=1 Tax=Hypoxylon rubiginosum TaxID=110542 RepID=A0ACB9YW94_9PEZI|nr:hypothetical protein F4820DRAFT_426923 [Hypoxylon rubiginosum]
MHLNGLVLESYVYVRPEPPPRKRIKPVAVLCVGFPRCETESLQQATGRIKAQIRLHLSRIRCRFRETKLRTPVARPD